MGDVAHRLDRRDRAAFLPRPKATMPSTTGRPADGRRASLRRSLARSTNRVDQFAGRRAAPAAHRLHDACEMCLDPTQPITVDDWIFLEIAHAALAGNLGLLDCVLVNVAAEIQSRRQPI